MKEYYIELPKEGISIGVTTYDNGGGEIISTLKKATTPVQADVLESFLLALACAGVNIGTPKVKTALCSTLEALANHA